MQDVLRQKLIDSLAAQPPPLTRRDIRLPAVRGKAPAVIGVRRSGKSTFLWQCIADRLSAGTPREDLVYISFEDERLAGIKPADSAWLVEEYYRLRPGTRDKRTVTSASMKFKRPPDGRLSSGGF
jgi:predicted AAA+ superfamily ATPase